MHRHLESRKYEKLVVSIGCGSCETELHAPENHLVVCIDINRRSLFAATYNYSRSSRKNLIISHHNMQDGVYHVLESVCATYSVPVVVLFQHPSPARDGANRWALCSAGKDCISCLLSGHVNEIHFVFDYVQGRNCWTKASLEKAFTKQCMPDMIADILVSEPHVVSETGSKKVEHPVFGAIPRAGWADMKSGQEVSFCIMSREEIVWI